MSEVIVNEWSAEFNPFKEGYGQIKQNGNRVCYFFVGYDYHIYLHKDNPDVPSGSYLGHEIPKTLLRGIVKFTKNRRRG